MSEVMTVENWSVRRIEKIRAINAASQYLEIGVEYGTTFLSVEMPRKDAVDPEFKFDTAAHASSEVRFFHQTSDAFWTSEYPRDRYDIIMLDGLHTFEQTFRDLICSMRYSHQGTVWLIDDTLPSDVFSAIPDKDRSLAARKRMNIPGYPWHGDVFKLVPMIFNFIPTLDYATIVGSGNTQTLAWYGRRRKFAPLALDLEDLSRLSFFDIDANRNLFNFGSEDDAFTRLRRRFQPGFPSNA